MMALDKAALAEKLHYSGPSGGGSGGYPAHSGGTGYGHSSGGPSSGHMYSSVGNSGPGGHHEHSYHHSSGGGGKKSIALSALTLLAFLFFLHILQTCLEDQMNMNTVTQSPQVIVMTARLDNQAEIMQKRKGEVEDFDEDYVKHIGVVAKNSQSRGLKRKVVVVNEEDASENTESSRAKN